jgi:hypothetical protein
MRLAAFEGDWTIERTIEDNLAGRPGRLEGVARFAPEGPALAYLEEGLLTLGDGPAAPASRRYLWRDGGAGSIEVLFGDGRFFHRFEPGAPAPAAVHECAPDQYRVRYDFSRWPRWTAEWRVRGPRKDYAMVTRYQRRPPPDTETPT